MNKTTYSIFAAGILIALIVTAGCVRKASPPPSELPYDAQTTVLPLGQDPVLIARGQLVFADTCALCHTVDGSSTASGPDLSDYGSEGWADARVVDLITDFQRYRPGSMMPTWDVSYPPEDIKAVAAYVQSLRREAFYLSGGGGQ